ncbi:MULTISPECIES: hypothetical protein [unclassified Bradyrhizobium]|uniref:hypothetical protein n=1 Tax=unclassified Bradyrhizobium TaxID=2631580 RepID=UPI001CD4F04D|nr:MULTISPECIES: hypothetical protein [unclassified Bradyrhizobium]MCA1378932.1 hypothetical protein [Bradyrhizobium sp. IC4060]MCA1489009.1 hypothetical protein [Bradyrhizobium sp. IC4061]
MIFSPVSINFTIQDSAFVIFAGDIRHVQETVGDVFLGQIALTAAATDEIVDGIARVDLEDVP